MASNRFPARNDDRRYFLLALGGSLLILSYQLLFPLSCDDEIYQSMARELLAYHWLPYLGSWDQNFPGIVYLHWLSIVLFGDTALSFHVFDLLLHLLLSWMLYRFVRRWLTPRMSLFAVLLYNLHYLSGAASTVGQRDAFASFFLLAGTVLLFRVQEHSSGRSYHIWLAAVASGFSFAMMFVLRGTYGTFLLVALVYLWASQPRSDSNLLAFTGGAVLVMLVVFLPYVLIPGGFEQVYQSIIQFNLEIYGGIRYPIPALLTQLRNQKFFLILSIAGIFLLYSRSLRSRRSIRSVLSNIAPLGKRQRMLLFSYAGASILSLVVMGKYFMDHFEPLLLVIVPFGGIALETLFALLRRKGYQIVAAILILVYYCVRVAPYPYLSSYAGSLLNGGRHPLRNVYDTFSDTGYTASVDDATASYLDQTTPRGARIAFASWNAGARWKTLRKSASRYTTFYSLASTTPSGAHPDFQRTWRRAYIDSLRRIAPDYLVLSTVMVHEFGISNSPLHYLHEIPGFDSEILPHYQFDTVMGTYVLFKRRD